MVILSTTETETVGPVNYRSGGPVRQQFPTSQQLLELECMTPWWKYG